MSDGKPIQLQYARPMPRDPRRPSVFGLIYILFLSLMTTGFVVYIVLAFLTDAPGSAGLGGVFGASFALLAALYARGKSRELFVTNLVMLGVSALAIVVSELIA